MVRRSKHAELEIRVSFEAVRIAPQCLAEAYERLVPIPRRPMRQIEPRGARSGLSAAARQPGLRRTEHG